jgi:hypothetical protein
VVSDLGRERLGEALFAPDAFATKRTALAA